MAEPTIETRHEPVPYERVLCDWAIELDHEIFDRERKRLHPVFECHFCACSQLEYSCSHGTISECIREHEEVTRVGGCELKASGVICIGHVDRIATLTHEYHLPQLDSSIGPIFHQYSSDGLCTRCIRERKRKNRQDAESLQVTKCFRSHSRSGIGLII